MAALGATFACEKTIIEDIETVSVPERSDRAPIECTARGIITH